MTTNRNCIKQWFITFPQCGNVKVEEFLRHSWTSVQLEEYSGVVEKHDTDGVHIHVNIKLKYGLSKAKMLNLMRIKYPDAYKRIDIRPTRQSCAKAKEGYLSKEGGEVFSKIQDIESVKAKKKKAVFDKIKLMELQFGPNKIAYINWVVDSGILNKY